MVTQNTGESQVDLWPICSPNPVSRGVIFTLLSQIQIPDAEAEEHAKPREI